MARDQAYAGAGGAGGVEVWQGWKIWAQKKLDGGLHSPAISAILLKALQDGRHSQALLLRLVSF